jgi:serine/tyrosine/threonine adenylyltransferase
MHAPLTADLAPAPWSWENTYAEALPDLVVPWQAAVPTEPRLLYLNRALATELGLDAALLVGPSGVAWLSGQKPWPGSRPVAQAYAGHQFGGFSPRLGDGRALLLGELIDSKGRRRDLAFKGSGRTPFSRGGDGKAAVGPMLREVLIGEAMHALGIPTTRALAVAATGETVVREQLLPGAILTRAAASHIRVGTFEYAATQQRPTLLQALADHTIERHYPAVHGDHPAGPPRYLALLDAMVRRQAELVARWMHVGFIHGVMNTDNMTLSGETIDYGPCAFMEAYNPQAVFSSIDTHGRYAFGNQPRIAQWNLARLAESFIPLIGGEPEAAVEQLVPVINGFPAIFSVALHRGQCVKLGLSSAAEPLAVNEGTGPDSGAEQTLDAALVHDWLALLHEQKMDFTLAHRRLAEATVGQEEPLLSLAADPRAVGAWLTRWHARCDQLDARQGLQPAAAQALRAGALRAANPLIIPRNHQVEAALDAASQANDLGPFERLLQAVQQPYDERPAHAEFSVPAPAEVTACYRTFCGT